VTTDGDGLPTPSTTARWLALPAPVHADADRTGTRLAVTALHVPLGTEEERPVLFVVDLATGEATSVPGLPEGAHTATWSPDGTLLALTIEHEGRQQLAVTAVAEPDSPTRVVTSLPVGVEGPASWSPDGRRLVVAGRRGRVTDPSRPWRTASAVPWVDGIGRLDDPPQLWICDVESGACSMLTDDEWHWSLPRWSPDGSAIAACASFDPAGAPPPQHLRIVSLDGSWSAPEVPGGMAVVAAWLDDGGLVVLTIDPADRPTGSTAQLHHVQLDGPIRRLDDGCPVEVGGQVYGDSAARLGDVPFGALMVRGDEIYVRTNEGGRMGVLRGSITTGEWQVVVTGDRCATPLAVGPYGLAIADQSAEYPCGIAVVSLESEPGAAGRVVPLPLPDPVDVPATAEVHRFVVPSPHDGVDLEGWHLRPPGVDGPLPTALIVHGGPSAAFGECFQIDAQALCAAGFGVLYTNPHGSTGSGDAFAHAVFDHWGDIPSDDVLAVVDHAVARGWADPDRLGVMGLSYGGYLTAWLACTTDRFRAGVSENPAIDLLGMYGSSDVGPWFTPMHFGGTPFDDVEPYLRWSPLLQADRCHTPLLFVVGLDDRRCPPTQALSMHRALRSLGRTSEVLILPDSDHAGSVYGPVPGRLAHDDAIVEWFDRWLRQD
jgi:dipeptidyl aminopeptidase/acylaminoacyl peptidase